jgi:hypothetical protein
MQPVILAANQEEQMRRLAVERASAPKFSSWFEG